jgi:hypothetical protein
MQKEARGGESRAKRGITGDLETNTKGESPFQMENFAVLRKVL